MYGEMPLMYHKTTAKGDHRFSLRALAARLWAHLPFGSRIRAAIDTLKKW